MKRFLFLLLFLASCNQSTPKTPIASPNASPTQPPAVERQVDGQIFVVTESDQNIPLALVDIKVFDSVRINSYVLDKTTPANEILKTLEDRFNAVQKELDTHIANEPKSLEALEKFAGTEHQSTIFDGTRMPSETDNFHNTVRFLSKLRDDYSYDYKVWPTCRFYFVDLPKPEFEVKSDSDGKFTLYLQQNASYVIAAHATRRVGELSNEYYWMIKLPLSTRHESPLLLSNHNMMTSNSNDSLLSCKGTNLTHSLKEEFAGNFLIHPDAPVEY